MGTYHERPGQDTLDLEALFIKRNSHLSDNTRQLKLARPAEIIYQEHDTVLALERNKAALRVGSVREEVEQLGYERVERGYRRDAAVARLVVDAHADLNLVILQVGLCRGGTGDMAMLEADANGAKMGGDVLGDVVDLVEAASTLGQRAGDLVNEYGSGETSALGSTLGPGGRGETDGAHLRPTILPWVLPTATSSPTITNLTLSDFSGCWAAYCSFARPKLRISPV